MQDVSFVNPCWVRIEAEAVYCTLGIFSGTFTGLKGGNFDEERESDKTYMPLLYKGNLI